MSKHKKELEKQLESFCLTFTWYPKTNEYLVSPEDLKKYGELCEQQAKKEVSLKIKKQMIKEYPYNKDLKRFLGIVSDECGFHSDDELQDLKIEHDLMKLNKKKGVK